MFGLTWLETYLMVISTAALIWAIKEVHEMVTVRKMWQRALTDPEYAGSVLANALWGLIQRMEHDEEFQENFMVFASTVGINVADAIRKYLQNTGQKIVKVARVIKLPRNSPFKPFEDLANELAPTFIEDLKRTKEAAKTVAKSIDIDVAFRPEK